MGQGGVEQDWVGVGGYRPEPAAAQGSDVPEEVRWGRAGEQSGAGWGEAGRGWGGAG